MKVEWEEIEHNQSGNIYRAEVPGGWLWKHVDEVPIYNPTIGELQWGLSWTYSITFQPKVAEISGIMTWDADGSVKKSV